MNRVVITGLGAVSPAGNGVDSLLGCLRNSKNCVKIMDEWSVYGGLLGKLGAPAELINEKEVPRNSRRSMSRMSIFALQAANEAIACSGLDPDFVSSGNFGCIIGSTIGSSVTLEEIFRKLLPENDLSRLKSTDFFKCLSHTAAMNIASCLKIKGWVESTSAACASGLQAIGCGFDLVRSGRQKAVICGGAEELSPLATGSFDVLYATSTRYNTEPTKSPRPFDAERDGLVCGEGCGIVVLETLEMAEKRNATIFGEILGYHTCGNGSHISDSSRDAIVACIKSAVADAKISMKQIDYINAHATGTVQGDLEEAMGLKALFGEYGTPVSSLKGHIGHTLGASGALELIASLIMLKENTIFPNLNLERTDPLFEGVNLLKDITRAEIKTVLKNSFAFGGINASMVICG